MYRVNGLGVGISIRVNSTPPSITIPPFFPGGRSHAAREGFRSGVIVIALTSHAL